MKPGVLTEPPQINENIEVQITQVRRPGNHIRIVNVHKPIHLRTHSLTEHILIVSTDSHRNSFKMLTIVVLKHAGNKMHARMFAKMAGHIANTKPSPGFIACRSWQRWQDRSKRLISCHHFLDLDSGKFGDQSVVLRIITGEK